MSGGLTTEQQLTMSLDEIKDARRAQRQRTKKSSRGAGGGSSRFRGTSFGRAAGPGSFKSLSTAPYSTGRSSSATKLSVTNLPYNVTEANLLELFSAIGRVSKVQLNYDRHGASTGSATVVYERYSDAMKAIEQYHNVQIDGRPIKIEMLLAPEKLDRLPGEPSGGKKSNDRGRGSTRGGRGGRKVGGGRERNGTKPNNTTATATAKSADDLNRELNSYMEVDDEGNKRQSAAI